MSQHSPSANCFDEETIQAMNDIAVLIRAGQQLQGMVRTFKKSPDLDKDLAQPDARKVLETVMRIARQLQQALFRGASRQTEELARARRSSESLLKAAAVARSLAEEEANATGGAGNVISVAVAAPLEALAARWKQDLATAEAGPQG